MCRSNYCARTLLTVLLALLMYSSFSQVQTNRQVLKKSAEIQSGKEKALFVRLLELSAQKNWKMVLRDAKGRLALLTGVDDFGYPVYTITNNNIVSAATIKTNQLWPGGSTGLNLSGSSNNITNKLAIWDAGKINTAHVELIGRVTQKDVPSAASDNHSTHVAGTLIASGVNPSAKGMAFGLQQLLAYDFSNQFQEMFDASPDLLVSNHSYGVIAGWYKNDAQSGRWEFQGRWGENEDYKFGYYNEDAQVWDSIAYNAPYYLIVKSAGNNRNENGPAVGQPYYRFNANNQMVSAGNRPAGISSNDGYDILPTYTTAKNILTIGAVNPIPAGYTKPSDVVMSAFSSWGPTDDGRIKPDVVADGVNVLSCIASSSNSYASYSGTSMASPAAAGSSLLLQEYYAKLHGGSFMRSATLRGLIIHTADEVGANAGPDYQAGWGLINMERAASVITANNTDQFIYEKTLNNGGNDALTVVASGKGPLVVTICWTDPKGNVITGTTSVLNNPTPKLVNDLDVRVTANGTTYMPWKLNPANPSAAATKGDNTLDNVEKIEIANPVPGLNYTITVNHKGSLQRGTQAYSMLISGAGGIAYCTSSPASNAGARIDNVHFSNINNNNASGCTTYKDFTNLTADVQPGQSLPISVTVSSCDASNVAKIVKVFIDYNNNGNFNDAGETAATSAVINGNNVFNGTIIIPGNVIINNTTRMRVVVQETNNASTISACGSYTRGETQDYTIRFSQPGIDAGIAALVSPEASGCANSTQLVTIRINNAGSNAISNVPVSATITNGTTTVATLNAIFPGNIPAQSNVLYTFQNGFNAVAGNTYTITSNVNFAGDQNSTNNQLVSTVVINGASSNPEATAAIDNNIAILKATPTGNDVFLWYDQLNATNPIAVGANASTTVIPSNGTYYVQKNAPRMSIGPATKDTYGAGGYERFSGNFIRFKNTVPLTIESARMYIGAGSASNKIKLTVGNNFEFDASANKYSYTPQASVTVDIYATGNNGAVFYFNLPVADTGEHILVLTQEDADNATFFRNNAIASNPYPIGVPGLFTILDNSASYSAQGTPTSYQQYYYFFYDMKLKLDNCPSDRVSVSASNGASASLRIGRDAAQHLRLFTIYFETTSTENVDLVMFNMMGQQVYKTSFNNVVGSLVKEIDPGNLPTGIYYVRLIQGKKYYTGRVVISPY